jgi:hypothetical protein
MDKLINLLISKFDTIFTLLVTFGGAFIGYIFSLIQQKRQREWELQNKWFEWHEQKISSVIIDYLDEQLELMSIIFKAYQNKDNLAYKDNEAIMFSNYGKAKMRIEAFNDEGLRIRFEVFQRQYHKFESSILNKELFEVVNSYISDASMIAGDILGLLKSQKRIIKNYKK